VDDIIQSIECGLIIGIGIIVVIICEVNDGLALLADVGLNVVRS